MQRSVTNGGRPESEVIVNFADGLSYSRAKMEEGLRNVLKEKRPPKPSKEAFTGKKEDVDLLVREFEITRQQAERTITDAKGDIHVALMSLINP